MQTLTITPPPAADAAWTAAQVARARVFTAEAVRALGASADMAEAVANGAGLMIDDWFATVTVLPIRDGRALDQAPMLVTLNTQRNMNDVDGDELLGLLALSSTLLAYETAVGFTPEGRLCLNRIVPAEKCGAAGVEHALRQVWQLARLLWQTPSTVGAQ